MEDMQKKILIIEDEPPLSKALVKELGDEGYIVKPAMNGLEGLKIAEELKPDLILLDLKMPKMDGVEFMKKLRQNDWGENIKVIVLTNLQANDEIISGLADTNPAYYLIKSDWNITDIKSKVREVLAA